MRPPSYACHHTWLRSQLCGRVIFRSIFYGICCTAGVFRKVANAGTTAVNEMAFSLVIHPLVCSFDVYVDVSTAMDIYADVMNETKKKALASFDGYMEKTRA